MSAQKIGDAFVNISVKGAAFAAKQIEDLKKSAEKQKQSGKGELSPMMMAFGAGGGAAVALMAIKGLEGAVRGLMNAIKMMQSEILKSIVRLSDLQKTADRIGTSSSWLSLMRLMVRDSNMSMQEFEQLIAAFQRNFETFSHDVGESKATLKSLGVSPELLRSWGDLETKMVELGYRINEIADADQRRGAAMRIFGEQGRKLIPLVASNRELYYVLKEQAKFLGLGHAEDGIRRADELRDSFVKMTMQTDALWEKLSIMLTPALQELLNYTIAATKTFTDFSAKIAGAADASAFLKGGITGIATAIQSMVGTAVMAIASLAASFMSAASAMLTIASGLVASIASVMAASDAMRTGTVSDDTLDLMQGAIDMKSAADGARKISATIMSEGSIFMFKFRENLNTWRSLIEAELEAMSEREDRTKEEMKVASKYAEIFRGEALGRSASTMQRLAEKQVKALERVERGVGELVKTIKDAPVIGVAE